MDELTATAVPQKIKDALQGAFPDLNLDTVEWSWEVYNKIYEAEFELDNAEYEVEITVTGHHLLTEKELSIADIPTKVMDAVKEKYPESNVSEVEQVTWSTGEVFYELDLEDQKGEEEREIHVSEDGRITAEGEDL